MNTVKYTIVKDSWHTVDTTVVRTWDDKIVTIEQEAADMVAHNSDAKFRDGAHRVRRNGKHVKTFKGETAWMDAERLADDLAFQAKHEKESN